MNGSPDLIGEERKRKLQETIEDIVAADEDYDFDQDELYPL